MRSAGLEERVAAARRAVISQTDLLHREFGRAESHWKPDGTRVTPVDLAVTDAIFRELGAQFGDDQFFSEEMTGVSEPIPLRARYTWILDPIDGTNNYVVGLPHCAISLALCVDGEPVHGVIYDLSRRTLMWGGPGWGAFDGGRPMQVSRPESGRKLYIGFHSPSDPALLPMAMNLLADFKIRGLGSAALHLAYVAAGMLDGCMDANARIWDVAAAIPLVRAAGGEVHFLNGPLLPLRQFDLRMRRIVYVAGSPAMCARLRSN